MMLRKIVSKMKINTWLIENIQRYYNLGEFFGKRSLDRISVDRNCVLSLDQNYVNHLIEFHLIESVDRKF